MAPPTTPDARHTADPVRTRAELERLRPDLTGRYDEALPGARAAIMSRLLLALEREPLGGRAGPLAGRAGLGRELPDSGRVPGAEPPGDRAPADPRAPGRGPINDGPINDGAINGRAAGDRAAEARAIVGGAADDRAIGDRAADDRAIGDRAIGDRAIGDRAAGDRTAGDRPELRRLVAAGDPAALARALWPDRALAAEIDNSVANLALARAAAPTHPATTLRDAAGDPDGPARLEQLVVDGHPLHPCCRTRGGMNVADVLAYAPEHRPVIRLHRLRVPAGRWHGDAPPLLYAHPFQAGRLLDEHPWLVDDGRTGPVRPLMSLRTVAPVSGGDHLKTAVDVQMTSAVRTVSPAAVHNGPRLSAVLAALTRDLPLTVLAETAGGAVIVDGEPQRRLGYLRRQAPAVRPDETVLPLAALAAGAPPLIVEAAGGRGPYRWLEDLAVILWPPLLAVLQRGVALEAHGQNTLVVLRDGRPVRILYRDLGGVRVSPARLRAAGVEAPPLLGDLPSDDPQVLRTKLAASAVTVVAAELIGLLERHLGADPARLWAIVAAAIRGAGTADADAILAGPLPLKATTAMRLAADPVEDIWVSVDNPLAGES